MAPWSAFLFAGFPALEGIQDIAHFPDAQGPEKLQGRNGGIRFDDAPDMDRRPHGRGNGDFKSIRMGAEERDLHCQNNIALFNSAANKKRNAVEVFKKGRVAAIAGFYPCKQTEKP